MKDVDIGIHVSLTIPFNEDTMTISVKEYDDAGISHILQETKQLIENDIGIYGFTTVHNILKLLPINHEKIPTYKKLITANMTVHKITEWRYESELGILHIKYWV